MGAKGIRRRKPYRRLPPPVVPTENDLIPPHIMWPAAGSGFEAHPDSPAGQAQRSYWVTNRLRRRGGVAGYAVAAVAWVFLVCFAYALVTTLLDMAR